MALGPAGVLATVLNRPGSLGPADGKRSRGDLPLRGVSFASAVQAADAIARMDAGAWRPFNLVLADYRDAFFVRGRGEGAPDVQPLGAGITMVTAHDPNDLQSPRIRRHLPRFTSAQPPDLDRRSWDPWEFMLADASFGAAGVAEALCVPPVDGFGTVASSLLALGSGGAWQWRFRAVGTRPGEYRLVARR